MSNSEYMRLALRLARRGYGTTSPNPMVGAVLVKRGRIIGQGWHQRAGQSHAEIEAINDAERRGNNVKGATLYVTLEPCSTHGRTPPCTDAIVTAGLNGVVVGATDPNPKHSGQGYAFLRRAGIDVISGVLGEDCSALNEAFNHWIIRRTPLVTVKAAMTLDGKIATAQGESKWLTSPPARSYAMHLRQGVDAILVGINTILADDPSLTFRPTQSQKGQPQFRPKRRIVLDSFARTPPRAKVVSDEYAGFTTIMVSRLAPKSRVSALAKQAHVMVAPFAKKKTAGWSARLDVSWVLKTLGAEEVTSLLVEGGGEVNASFLFQRLAQRIAFFYAPKVLGGREAPLAVGGRGINALNDALQLTNIRWRRLGPDLLLSAAIR